MPHTHSHKWTDCSRSSTRNLGTTYGERGEDGGCPEHWRYPLGSPQLLSSHHASVSHLAKWDLRIQHATETNWVNRGRGFTEWVRGWLSFSSLLGGVVTVPRISSNARAAQPRALAHAALSRSHTPTPPHPRVPAPADLAAPGFLSPFQSRGAPGREGLGSIVGGDSKLRAWLIHLTFRVKPGNDQGPR